MNLTEKAAYLKGLAEGLSLEPDAKETKLFNAMLDMLDDLALTVSDLDDEVSLIGEQLDAVDEDLDELEEFVYEDLDCGCDCFDDDDDEIFEIECPACHETISFDESIFDDDEDICCPACGAVLEDVIFDEEDE